MKGYEAYIQILAMCPCTNERVAEKLEIRVSQASKYTRQLVKVGLIQAVDGTGKGGIPTIYARGGKRTPMTRRPTQEAIALSVAIKALEEPRTTAELGQIMGVTPSSAANMLRKLRAHNLVHISHWDIANVTRVPVWMLGGGKNVKRPPTKPRTLVNKQHCDTLRWRKLQTRMRVLHEMPEVSMQG